MAGQTTDFQKTYILDSNECPQYTVVQRSTAPYTCKVPAADNVEFLGVVSNDGKTNDPLRSPGSKKGKMIAVQLMGIAESTASGNVTYGDKLIVASGGGVKKMPITAGTYNVIGTAEDTVSSGEIVPFLIRPEKVVVAS
jgi:hypothetical protein